MKVRVVFTVEVSDEERLALTGTDTPATHLEVADWFRHMGIDQGHESLKGLVRDYYKAKAAFYAEKASEGTTGAQGTG